MATCAAGAGCYRRRLHVLRTGELPVLDLQVERRMVVIEKRLQRGRGISRRKNISEGDGVIDRHDDIDVPRIAIEVAVVKAARVIAEVQVNVTERRKREIGDAAEFGDEQVFLAAVVGEKIPPPVFFKRFSEFPGGNVLPRSAKIRSRTGIRQGACRSRRRWC